MGNKNSITQNNTETSESSNFHTINSDIFLSSLGNKSKYNNNSSINDNNINQKIIRLTNILGGNFSNASINSESVLDQIFNETNNNKQNNYDTITSLNMNSNDNLSNTSPFINNEIVRNMVQQGGRQSDSSSNLSSQTSSESLSISNTTLSDDKDETVDYMSSTAHTGGALTSESISYKSQVSDNLSSSSNNFNKKNNTHNNKDFIYQSDDESSLSSPYKTISESDMNGSNSESETNNKSETDTFVPSESDMNYQSESDMNYQSKTVSESDMNGGDSETSNHYRLQYSDNDTVASDEINTENINIISYD